MESPLNRLIPKTPMSILIAGRRFESHQWRFISRGGYKTKGQLSRGRTAKMAEDVFLMSDVFNSDSYGFLETETWSLSVADNMFELMNFKVSVEH